MLYRALLSGFLGYFSRYIIQGMCRQFMESACSTSAIYYFHKWRNAVLLLAPPLPPLDWC